MATPLVTGAVGVSTVGVAGALSWLVLQTFHVTMPSEVAGVFASGLLYVIHALVVKFKLNGNGG